MVGRWVLGGGNKKNSVVPSAFVSGIVSRFVGMCQNGIVAVGFGAKAALGPVGH